MSLGARLGALLPLLVLGVMLLVLYLHSSEGKFLTHLNYHGVLSRLLSLSVLINAVLFFVCIHTNRLRTARGFLGATVVYGIVVFLFFFIF